MYYYFYKITNNIDGKYYYGVHSTTNINDGYMGSGQYIRNAINKYGVNNFTKTIMRYFVDNNDMYEYEKLIVNNDIVNDPMSYNIALGGKGNPIYGLTNEQKEIWKNKIRDAHIGKTLSDEHKKNIGLSNIGKHDSLKGRKRPNISKALKGHIPWNKGISATEESKEKNRQSHLGKKASEETKRRMCISQSGKKKPKTSEKLLGKPKSEEHKQHIREAKLGTHPSEETRQKIRDSHKGKHWKLINGTRVYY